MHYSTYTKQLMRETYKDAKNVLLLAPDCPLDLTITSETPYEIIYNNKFTVPKGDWFETIMKISKEVTKKPFDVVIGLRIFEHIPIRNVDYFLYLLSSVMKYNGTLHLVVPDSRALSKKIINHIDNNMNKQIDFKFQRYCYEMFSEGSSIEDYHKIWTDRETMKIYLEQENLFCIDTINNMTLDFNGCPELCIKARRS